MWTGGFGFPCSRHTSCSCPRSSVGPRAGLFIWQTAVKVQGGGILLKLPSMPPPSPHSFCYPHCMVGQSLCPCFAAPSSPLSHVLPPRGGTPRRVSGHISEGIKNKRCHLSCPLSSRALRAPGVEDKLIVWDYCQPLSRVNELCHALIPMSLVVWGGGGMCDCPEGTTCGCTAEECVGWLRACKLLGV